MQAVAEVISPLTPASGTTSVIWFRSPQLLFVSSSSTLVMALVYSRVAMAQGTRYYDLLSLPPSLPPQFYADEYAYGDTLGKEDG